MNFSDEIVSVIIPVYNCEDYLRDSFRSIAEQTIFEQLEIIIVDDGSVDNSLVIEMEFASKYKNIKVITQLNQGVSVARNTGIKEAKGNYIVFFDADDYAAPTLYERLLELCVVESADISIVDYKMRFIDGNEIKHRNTVKNKWTDMDEALISFFKENLICTNSVDKMFSAKIVKQIKFPEGYSIGEDMYFVYRAITMANSIVVDSSECLYTYCLRHGSAMKSSFSRKHIDAVLLANEIVSDFDNSTVLYEYAYANYIHEICKMLALLNKSGKFCLFREDIIKYQKDLKKYSITDSLKYMSKKHVVAILLMKISPSIYQLVYNTLKVG